MKKIMILFLSILLSVFANAQVNAFPKNEEGKYEFSEVIETGLSKSTLYANAISWATSFYKDEYKEALQVASETEGRIIIKNYNIVFYKREKPKSDYINMEREYVEYTLTIDCKENKYRYVISDILINPSPVYDSPHEYRLEKINELNSEKEDLEKQIRVLDQTLSGKKIEKEKKKLSIKIDDLNTKIEEHQTYYDGENEVFDRIIQTLKKRMANNDDF